MHSIPVLAGIFATSFVIAFSGALMPGPLFTFTISETGRRGAVTGPLLICGHAILELGMVAVLLLGFGPFLQKPIVSGIIGLAGAGVLAWLAFGLLRSVPTLRLSAVTGVIRDGKPRAAWGPVGYGIVMSLANPYWTLWWVTIGLGYIMMSTKYGIPGVAAFFTGHILADLAWYSAVSFSFARGARLINDSVYKGIIAVCGTALVAFAVWFGWTGVAALARA